MKRNGRKSLAGALARAKNESGFTLVELIVVIAILGILAGVAVPAYSGYIKKANMAADEILLDGLNTAFAAACIENGVDHTNVTASEEHWDDKTVDTITSLSGTGITAEKAEDIIASFEDIFEGAEFKTTTDLAFSKGVFILSEDARVLRYNGYDFVVSQAAIEALQNSTFGTTIGAEKLLGQVSDVADLASNAMISGGEGSVLFDIAFDPEYLADLADSLDMSIGELDAYLTAQDDSGAQFLANSLVLTVAQSTTGKSPSEVAAKITSGDFVSNLGTELSNAETAQSALADAALAYGLYTSYVYAEGTEEQQASLGSITDFTSLKSALGVMTGNDFKTYLNGEKGQADLDAYMASMDVISSTTGTPNATKAVLENGFSDRELVTLLDGVMSQD